MFNLDKLINSISLNFYTILVGFLIFLTLSFFKRFISFFVVTCCMAKFWIILSSLNFYYIWKVQNTLDFCDTINNLSINVNITQNWFFTENLLLGFDKPTFFFLFVVSIISAFANYHTLYYMRFDQKKEKFVFFLNSFAFSMVFLLISRNLFTLFLFWELLGITSFFLIKHNDTQQESLKSAMKAFSFNKVSDILFVFTIIIYFSVTRSFSINNSDILSLVGLSTNHNDISKYIIINLMLFFIFVSACIKSVQIFSYWWLPDSMKAPVPASALIHSATLVTAGFFVILLFKPLFSFYWGHSIFLVVGSATFILGSVVAGYQDDLKKSLAYSTIANCGMMLCLLFNHNLDLFLVYFLVHGITKSLSFMFCGEIITIQNHSQDSRTYTLNSGSLLVSVSGFILSVLVLAGLPITIMYLIKHHFSVPTFCIYYWHWFNSLFTIYGFLSIFYAINLITKVFYSGPNNKVNNELFQLTFYKSGYFNLIYALLALFLAGKFAMYLNYTKHWDGFSSLYRIDQLVNLLCVLVAWGFILNFYTTTNLSVGSRRFTFSVIMFLCLYNITVCFFNHVVFFIGETFNIFWFYNLLAYMQDFFNFLQHNLHDFLNVNTYPKQLYTGPLGPDNQLTGLQFCDCPAPEIVREIYLLYIRKYIFWPVVKVTDYIILEPWYWRFSCWADERFEDFIQYVAKIVKEWKSGDSKKGGSPL